MATEVNLASSTSSWLVKLFWLLFKAGETGMGMFLESYFIFAIGNLSAVWKIEFPGCFGSTSPNITEAQTCPAGLEKSGTYVEVAGIIIGMIFFATIANELGRKVGSRGTVTIMLIGSIILCSAYGYDATTMFIMLDVGLGIFAFGVGGEYPIASCTAAESSESVGDDAHRGRTIALTFSMQGWGNFTNTLIILIITLGNGTSVCTEALAGAPECSMESLNIVWRVSYIVGIFFILVVCVYRFCYLEESKVWLERKAEIKRMNSKVLRTERRNARKVLFCDPLYNMRLIAAAVCWFIWDIVFYGNKLFQATMIKGVIGPNPTLGDIYSYTLINSAVALAGYYLCAFTIDKSWMGRTRMQGMGFLIIGILYLIAGYMYSTLSLPENMSGFLALYFLASLFGQWGPNGTTFILPSEMFPTDIRTFTHGFAVSIGKLGALTATLLFSFGNGGQPVSAQFIFIIDGYVSLAALLLTIIFIPNTTRVPLAEVDKRWECKLLGYHYTGPAEAPENLSFAEILYFHWIKGGNKGNPEKERGSSSEEPKAQAEESEIGKPEQGLENEKVITAI